MLKYKILIKLLVLNYVSEGCSSAVYVVSPSQWCCVVVSAGRTV